jgi:hypothetical protein
MTLLPCEGSRSEPQDSETLHAHTGPITGDPVNEAIQRAVDACEGFDTKRSFRATRLLPPSLCA